MKAEELMIGDWVRISLSKTNLDSHKGKVAKVTELKSYPNWNSIKVTTGGLDEYYCERDDEIEPIPLTTEILEKNGFNIENNNELTYSVWYDGEMHISIWYGKHFIEDLYISYVHQLQHALRLCGIDKEIIL